MSDSLDQTEGGLAAQTVTLNAPSAFDSLSLALRDRACRVPPGAAPERHKKSRRLAVSYYVTDKPGVRVPYMRLCGRWLQDAGFVIGRHVKIEVGEGRLTIEQVD